MAPGACGAPGPRPTAAEAVGEPPGCVLPATSSVSQLFLAPRLCPLRLCLQSGHCLQT